MFKLYSSEECLLEVKSDPTIEARKKSSYLLILGIILLVVGIFYQYASTQDNILLFVAWGSLFGGIGSIIAYFYQLNKAKKNGEQATYYITNTRVVKVDEEGKVVQEVLRNKIKRIHVEKIKGSAGNVVINPREISDQERYKRELQGKRGSNYTKDTFVVSSIKNAEEFKAALKA